MRLKFNELEQAWKMVLNFEYMRIVCVHAGDIEINEFSWETTFQRF